MSGATDAFTRLLPVRVDRAALEGPTLLIGGSSWSLSATCEWRWVKADGSVVPASTVTASHMVSDLIGEEIVHASWQGPAVLGRDPSFGFTSGGSLDLFSDAAFDTWVLHTPDLVLVGPLRERQPDEPPLGISGTAAGGPSDDPVDEAIGPTQHHDAPNLPVARPRLGLTSPTRLEHSDRGTVADREIARVDWHRLTEANGSAAGIGPALARLITSSDPDEARAAYWQLENHVVVQGQVYEAAIEVVTVLLASLADERSRPARISALDLLFQILNGQSMKQSDTDADVFKQCLDRAREGFWILVREANQGEREAATDVIRLIQPDAARLRSALGLAEDGH